MENEEREPSGIGGFVSGCTAGAVVTCLFTMFVPTIILQVAGIAGLAIYVAPKVMAIVRRGTGDPRNDANGNGVLDV